MAKTFKLNHLWITWFGCGRFPKAPGTVGSIGALPLCWLTLQIDAISIRIIFAVVFTCLAIYGSTLDQSRSKKKDPGYIVIDEVAGMLWSTCWLPHPSLLLLVLAFVLFRIFDIFKPFPVNKIDQLSKISSHPTTRGAAIVLDDVLAGLITSFLLGLALSQGWVSQTLL